MLHDQILEQLKQFEYGLVDEKKLEEWVLSHLQQILDSGENRAIELANDLDALFIQEGEGIISSAEIRQNIAMLFAREMTTVWREFGDFLTRTISEPTTHKQWGTPDVVTGVRTLQAA